MATSSTSSAPTASAIVWPEQFRPGFVDNFVSNEVIARGLTAAQVWPFLADTAHWPAYYDNASQITAPASGSLLQHPGDKFSFATFGFPPLNMELREAVAPTPTTPGRLAWAAHQGGEASEVLDVYHAWIVEDVYYEGTSEKVVRILTQESQNGQPAAALAQEKPNPMLLGHQNWLDSLVKYAKEKTA